MKEKVAVSKRLSENIAQMEEFFHECDDIKKKELMLGRQMDVACYLTFIEVSVDMGTSALSEVLKYLKGLGKEEIYQALEQNALGISDATYFDTIEDAVDGLLTGEVILFVDGFDRAVKIPDDGYPNMGITEADSEKVIRGSNEGFCDSVKQNAALIRKRIRSPKVKVKAKNGELNLMKHISWKYDKLPHMLISGDTGSGKTIFLLIVIKALLESGAVLHICDPKKADLSFLSRIMPDVHYDTESIMECVEAFYEGMEARYDEMQEHPDFRMGANYAKVGLTPHFLIFDEYVAFMDTLAKKEWEEVMKLIRIIIMKGRQAGYFIILACQRPDAKYLGDGVRDQFGFRVALGSMSASGYTMMFGSIDKQFKEKDIAGRGYVNTGNGVVTEFYAPYVDPGYDFFTELSRIYEERQQEGEAYDRMYENGSETAGEE